MQMNCEYVSWFPAAPGGTEKYCRWLGTTVCCWQKLSANFKLNSWLWELRVCLQHLENTEALISLAYFKDVFGKTKLPIYKHLSLHCGKAEFGKSFAFWNLNSSQQFPPLLLQICPWQVILHYCYKGNAAVCTWSWKIFCH